VLEAPNVEEGEVEHLAHPVPIGREPDIGCLCVLPKSFLRELQKSFGDLRIIARLDQVWRFLHDPIPDLKHMRAN